MRAGPAAVASIGLRVPPASPPAACGRSCRAGRPCGRTSLRGSSRSRESLRRAPGSRRPGNPGSARPAPDTSGTSFCTTSVTYTSGGRRSDGRRLLAAGHAERGGQYDGAEQCFSCVSYHAHVSLSCIEHRALRVHNSLRAGGRLPPGCATGYRPRPLSRSRASILSRTYWGNPTSRHPPPLDSHQGIDAHRVRRHQFVQVKDRRLLRSARLEQFGTSASLSHPPDG